MDFDINRATTGGHDARINEVCHRTRIVNRRIDEVLIVLIGLAEEVHQTGHELGEISANAFDTLLHFGRAQCLMRQIQSDHGDRPGFIEHDVSGFRIDLDVELGHGTPVAHMVSAAHKHDFLDTFNNARLHAGGHGNVGQRSGRHQSDGAWLVAHNGVDNPVDGMAGFQRTAGFRQFNAVKTGFAVNGSCHFLLAHQRTVTSGMHRHVGGMRLFQHCTGVVGHLVKALIATYRGDAQQIDIRIAHGKQDGDGVIMSRIAIKDDFLGHYGSSLCTPTLNR